MAYVMVSPERQIENISNALSETESRLERAGINAYLIRTWLNQQLLLRELQEQHRRGELQPIEYDENDD